MSCQSTPTATLFGTTVTTSFSLSTSVSTETALVAVDGFILITTCLAPTAPVVGSSTTAICVPTVISSFIGSIITTTILHTTVQTVPPPLTRSITTPTQTLFGPCPTDPDNNRPVDPVISTTTSTTSTTSSTSTPTFIAPVTITSIFSSTDPNGVVIVQTSKIVSTPSPEPNQYGSSSSNTPAIIGGVVGGAAALIAIIAIVWFIMYKKRSGSWDSGHQAGAPETKGARPAVDDNGSSPNPYGYGAPSPLFRGDQHSAVHRHSLSASTATGYADHRRTNSQTPLILTGLPPHSLPNSPPSLHPPQLPGTGAGLDRTHTPVWASPSAQQEYFQHGYPPTPSDPNFTPSMTSTAISRATSATASSTHGLLISPTLTAANSAVAYPPGAAPPVIGAARRSTYNEYHKAPLEQPLQGSNRPPSQYQQPGPNITTANLNSKDAPVDKSAEFYPAAAGSASVHTPSIRYDKGELSGAFSVPVGTPEPTHKTSLVPAPQGAGKATSPAPILEDAPPAYQQ